MPGERFHYYTIHAAWLLLLHALDFPISEADVRRDSQRYVQAIEDRDIGRMNQAVQLISGRSTRLAEVVRMDLRDDAESYSAHHVTQIGRSIERLLEKGTQCS